MGKMCLKEAKPGMAHIQLLVPWYVPRKAFPTLCLSCGSRDIYSKKDREEESRAHRSGSRDQRDYNRERTVFTITCLYTILLLNI